MAFYPANRTLHLTLSATAAMLVTALAERAAAGRINAHAFRDLAKRKALRQQALVWVERIFAGALFMHRTVLLAMTLTSRQASFAPARRSARR